MTTHPTTKKGFVLLYALLVASVVLVVGLTLSNIILKQLIISSVSREMNQAYYVANAGRECAALMQAAEVKANELRNPDTPVSLPVGKTISCADTDSTNHVVETSPHYEWGGLSDSVSQFGSNNQLQYEYIVDPRTSQKKLVCSLLDIQSLKTISSTLGQNVNNLHVVWALGYNTDCPGNNPTVDTSRQVERIICEDFDQDPSQHGDEICAAER